MIKPLQDRVIVKRKDAETKTSSGIIIPDTAKEQPQEGVIIAVGEGKKEDGKRMPLDVKKGDNILFSKYAGTIFSNQRSTERFFYNYIPSFRT